MDPKYSTTDEHDFGTVLALGQSLGHEFTLRNPADRPIHLLNGTATTPCCSAIGRLPESIAPGGEITIPVVLKAGFRSERKRVGFMIETDDQERPAYSLFLRANLVAEWEVEEDDGAMDSVPLGQAGSRTIRVIARQVGGRGRNLPERLSTTGKTEARFEGPAVETKDQSGLVATRRGISLQYPALRTPGLQVDELRFSWSDGRSESAQVRWEVRHALSVRPSGLVLRSSETNVKRVVVLESDGSPFLVTAAKGILLKSSPVLPREASRVVEIPIVLDLSRAEVGKAVDVIFETNHPTQKTAVLSVMVLADSPGGAR